MTKYWVRGGIYIDAEFRQLEPLTAEEYGPFSDYAEAYRVWKRYTFTQKLDIAGHKLQIVEDAE